jgi:hypothetical protein
MNDIWNNWEESETKLYVNGSIVYVRTFFDTDGDCFTIASQFCIHTNMSRALFYRGWA